VNKMEIKDQEKEVIITQEEKFDPQNFLVKHSVTLLFIIISIAAVYISKLPIFFVVNSIITRVTRNSFLVLALLIPVMSGMGLNFSITIGAMAGQFAIIIVTYLGISGIWGFILCALIALPLAIIFGFFVGALLNKTKGQEMITGLISGFFANGIYQLILIFMVGTIIPMKMNDMMMSSGVGIRNTVDMKKAGLSYALDSIHEIPLFTLVLVVSLFFIALNIYKLKSAKHESAFKTKKRYFNIVLNILVFIFGMLISYTKMLPRNIQMLENITIPTVTSLLIIALCFFNVLITKTKLGQDFRTVGQNKHIAEIAGIHVNKVRMYAIIISTVLASWGQLFFLQNMGVLNTYGSHVQIALFSIAALLIGGASASKATISQALLGVVLFHTLFLVSPMAGKNLFGDPMIGEFFRAFIAYGVIGVSLGLHAWRKTIKGQV